MHETCVKNKRAGVERTKINFNKITCRMTAMCY